MSLTTFSGPVRSLGGFITPVIYVRATDVVAGEYQIPYSGAKVVILSEAADGPTAPVTFLLPLVTVDGGFNLLGTNGEPINNGIEGSILNYSADNAHVLKGADTGASNQLVNGSANGVAIPTTSVVQWGGNGNPDAPWAAIANTLATPL